MRLSDTIVSRVRERSVTLYDEVKMGASAPVSSQQIKDASAVLDAKVSKTDARTVLGVAKERKTRAQIRDYARKTIPSSELSPDAKLVLARVTSSYKKAWTRKSAVMLEAFLTTKLEEPKPRTKRAAKRAAKKS